jgi:excisionase family DNA binding protein
MATLRRAWWTLCSTLLFVFACLVLAVAGADPEGLWSTDGVADYLGVPASTVRYWVWMGIGPKSMKIGRYRRFKARDVEKWAESQTELPDLTPRARSRLANRRTSATAATKVAPRKVGSSKTTRSKPTRSSQPRTSTG